jgi:hypothetical protein
MSNERLPDEECARVSAAIQISEEQAKAAENQPNGDESKEERLPEHEALDDYYQAQDDAASLLGLQARLADLKAHRDRQRLPEDDEGFIPYRDCDRVLGPGTIVKINGVPCRLLLHSPVIAETFRDEAVFAQSLAAAADGSLAANAEGLRNLYNRNGVAIGVNEAHSHNRLGAEIAKLEQKMKELEEAAAAPPEDESEKAE